MRLPCETPKVMDDETLQNHQAFVYAEVGEEDHRGKGSGKP